MNSHRLIMELLQTSRVVLFRYLEDLCTEDLYVRPVDNSHTAAWQLGHILLSEHMMMKNIGCSDGIKLPLKFDQAHSKHCGYAYPENTGFLKEEYVEMLQSQRRILCAFLETLSVEDLDRPGPIEMRAYAPYVGSVFVAIGSHEILHAGQIAVIRRRLGKDVRI